MTTHVYIPMELMEEILYRLPSLHLSRFRTVSKEWNTLFNNKTFINKHLSLIRPRFLLWTNSKVYSLGINDLDDDLIIELSELPLDIPDLNHRTTNFLPCNNLLFCSSWWWNNKVMVWNSSSRQTRWIMSGEEHFRFCGIGYDNGNYRIFGYSDCLRNDNNGKPSQFYRKFSLYNFETNSWKCIDVVSEEETSIRENSLANNVSLNGNLYWVTHRFKTDEYLIKTFDFSEERLKIFGVLPWKKNTYDTPVLSVFRGDRISILSKLRGKNNIKIWVTKNKINQGVENVVLVMFMQITLPIYEGSYPSYFIDDIYVKRLVLCCSDETGKGCIYVVSGNTMKKIQIGFGVSEFSHCFYDPSLIPIPPESSDQERIK